MPDEKDPALIESHTAMLAKIGSGQQVAQRLGNGITDKMVRQWRWRGRIPYRWRPFVVAYLQKQGFRVPKTFIMESK